MQWLTTWRLRRAESALQEARNTRVLCESDEPTYGGIYTHRALEEAKVIERDCREAVRRLRRKLGVPA